MSITASASKGDWRVLFVMNLVLSAAFSYLVITGLAFIDALEFSWLAVGTATVVLMIVTYLVVL